MPFYQGIDDTNGFVVVRVDRPGDHLHLASGVPLERVEPTVGRKVRVHGQRLQTGEPVDKQIPEVRVDPLDGAVGQPRVQHAGALGEQHRPVGGEIDAPGVGQARDDFRHHQLRTRFAGAHDAGRNSLSGLA